MGGVDHHDWLLEKFSISIRGKKWYWPLFTRIIDMAVTNTFVILNKLGPTNIKDVRRNIAVPYLKLGHCMKQRAGRPVSVQRAHKRVLDQVRLDQRGHTIAKRANQRRCQMQNCAGRPLTYCVKCNVTLCTTCFVKFHSS